MDSDDETNDNYKNEVQKDVARGARGVARAPSNDRGDGRSLECLFEMSMMSSNEQAYARR